MRSSHRQVSKHRSYACDGAGCGLSSVRGAQAEISDGSAAARLLPTHHPGGASVAPPRSVMNRPRLIDPLVDPRGISSGTRPRCPSQAVAAGRQCQRAASGGNEHCPEAVRDVVKGMRGRARLPAAGSARQDPRAHALCHEMANGLGKTCAPQWHTSRNSLSDAVG